LYNEVAKVKQQQSSLQHLRIEKKLTSASDGLRSPLNALGWVAVGIGQEGQGAFRVK
jgi:hypothetical protein